MQPVVFRIPVPNLLSRPHPKEELVAGFTPIEVGSYWKYGILSQSANGHNGTFGAAQGIRTIEILSKSDSAGSTVYQAALGDTAVEILGNTGLPMDTSYVRRRTLFEIMEHSGTLTVTGFAGNMMLPRIFRTHTYDLSITRMFYPSGDSALAGADSVLTAKDDGISADQFDYWVTQAQGIGAYFYSENFGYPGGLKTGDIAYRLKAFRIGFGP